MTIATDLPFIVKVCGITNEEDARVAVTAGANALGFNFYRRSPRYLTAERAREIVSAVPGSFLKVGVFVNPAEDELLEIAGQVPLDILQLHGDDCPLSLNAPYRIWRSIAPGKQPPPYDPTIEAYLLDTPTPQFGGSGITFTWVLAKRFPYRAIIAGGLDAQNVVEAIGLTSPWGVDACSRLEASPGKKDPRRVRDFVWAALTANRAAQELNL